MIKEYLISKKDQNYKEFTVKLVPNVDKKYFIGVRIPILRKYAKNLAKNKDILSIINSSQSSYLQQVPYFVEEVLLYGFIINYCDVSITKKLEMYNSLMPYLTCWYQTDSIFQGIKDFLVISNRSVVFSYFSNLALSDKEYYSRSGIVVLLRYFLSSDYIDKTIEVFTKITAKQYYVIMGLSWAIAELLAVDFTKGYTLLTSGKISKEVTLNSIKKATESYKITKEQKQILKEYRQNIAN